MPAEILCPGRFSQQFMRDYLISCACVLRGIPTSMHLDLGWGFELAIEALEKVNYDVDNLEQRFRDTLVDTFSEGRPDAEIAASVLEWDCDRADDALDALHDALTRDSSEESTTAFAEMKATLIRVLSSFFKGDRAEGENSDDAKIVQEPEQHGSTPDDAKIVQEPEQHGCTPGFSARQFRKKIARITNMHGYFSGKS